MRALRRTLRVFGILAAFIVCLLVAAVLVSQTAWFRDWLRRYAMRESAQFINGQLLIGRIDGGLWGGVQLHDVRITRDGDTVVSLDLLDLEYSLIDFVRQGVAVEKVELVAPVLHLRRDGDTWNVATLIVTQPSDPDAPRASFRVASLLLRDGTVTVTDPTCPPEQAGCLPARIDDLRLSGHVESSPEALEAGIEEASLQTSDPAVSLRRLTAALRMTDQDLAVNDLAIETGASRLTGRAQVDDFAGTPTIDASLTASPLSMAEVARFVPQVTRTDLVPEIDLTAQGPLDALRIDLDTTSAAGNLQAELVADAAEPGYGARGTATVTDLDVGAWLGDPTQRTDLTATTTVDVTGSDLASLAGSVVLDASRVEAQGYAVEALQARATLDRGTADLTASLGAYGAQASTRGTVDYTRVEDGVIALDLRGGLQGLDVRRLPASLGAPRISSNVGLDYEVAGTLDKLRAAATFAESRVDTLVIGRGTRAIVTVDGSRIGYDVDGQVRDVDLQRLGEVLDIAALDAPAYASDLDATVQVAGHGTTVASAVAEAHIALVDSTLAGATVPELRIDVTANRGAVEARAAGRIAGLRPEVLSGRDDLAGEVAGRFDVSASLPDVAAQIDPTRLTASAELALDPSTVGGVTLEETRLSARLDAGVGEIATLHVVSPVIEVDASGPVSLVERADSRLTYAVRVKDAGALADLGGVAGVAGTAQLDGTLTGWLDQLTAEGTVTADDVVYDQTASVEHLSGTYRASLPEQDVNRIDATARVEASGVDASGTSLDTLALETTYADRSATFDANLTQADLRAGAAGQATLGETGQVVTLRRLDAQSPRFTWALAPGATPRIVHDAGLVTIEGLDLASGPQQLAVDGAVRLPSDTAPFSADDLQVRATAIDLAPIGEQFAPERAIAGTLNADVTLSGTLDSGRGRGQVSLSNGSVEGFTFDALTADADIADGAVQLDAALQQSPTSNLTVRGRVPIPVSAGDAAVTPPATGAAADTLDLTIGGSGIDLAVVEGVTDQVSDVRGRLLVDARVTGTLDAPAVDGSVRIQDGAFRVPLVDVTYEGLQADVQLAPDVIRVATLRLQDGHGHSFDVTGTLGLDGTTLGDVGLKATADEFRLIDNDLGDVRVTTDLEISGTPSAPVIRGSVTVPESLIAIDRMLVALQGLDDTAVPDDVDFVYTPETDVADGPPEPAPPVIDLDEVDDPGVRDIADETSKTAQEGPLGAPVDANAPPPTPTILEAATVDVQFTVPDDLVIRGDDVRAGDGPSLGALNVTMGADVRATSSPGTPLVMTGQVSTIRGYYDFQGRRFEVVRDGEIRFDGADYTDPSLDLAATRDISGVVARIGIRGTAQDPELVLSSTPSLDEADILALIVFNRPLDDLGSGEQVSLARRAGELVGGRLTGGLATSLRDALGVDQFEIDAFGASGPNVTLGNRLGERIYIRIRQQLGAQDLSQVLLEYELLRNLRLQTSVTQGARTNRSPGQRVERNGIDLLYFFYY